jgi:hypothetical protein
VVHLKIALHWVIFQGFVWAHNPKTREFGTKVAKFTNNNVFQGVHLQMWGEVLPWEATLTHTSGLPLIPQEACAMTLLAFMLVGQSPHHNMIRCCDRGGVYSSSNVTIERFLAVTIILAAASHRCKNRKKGGNEKWKNTFLHEGKWKYTIQKLCTVSQRVIFHLQKKSADKNKIGAKVPKKRGE